MLRPSSLFLFGALLASCATATSNTQDSSQGNGGAGGDDSGDGGAGGSQDPPIKELPLIKGLGIGKVTLNQGVAVTLFNQGTEVSPRNAPVVQGRDALVRVFFQPEAAWVPRPTVVRLTLKTAALSHTFEISGTPPNAGSTEDNAQSTATFEVPHDYFTGDLTYSVTLHEATTDATGEGTSDLAAMPPSGLATMGDQSAGGPLRVVIIPIQYDVGNVHSVPDVSNDTLEKFRLGALAMYPVPYVEISVGETMSWSKNVANNGTGWTQLVQAMVGRRAQDAPGNDIYYYGIFNPAASMESYCGVGCVAGLSPLASQASQSELRVSVGLGFDDETTVRTMLHEVGHAHGRSHAPCAPGGQIDGVDPSYPYSGAVIGVTGYDLINKAVKGAQTYTDIMGYCDPTWISDYTYKALFDRTVAVHNMGYQMAPHGPTRWRQAWLDLAGELRWGDTLTTLVPPDGEPRQVTLEGLPGTKPTTVKGYFYGMSHLPTGLLLLPEASPQTPSLSTKEGHFQVDLGPQRGVPEESLGGGGAAGAEAEFEQLAGLGASLVADQGPDVIEEPAEGVHVVGEARGAAGDAFGREVARGAAGPVLAGLAGEAEVGEQRGAAGEQEHVAGLDVPVRPAGRVGAGEASDEGFEPLAHGQEPRAIALPDGLPQRAAPGPFEGEPAFVEVGVEHADDAGSGHLGGDEGLALHLLAVVAGAVVDLERDAAAEGLVARLVDHRSAAPAGLRHDAEGSRGLGRREERRVVSLGRQGAERDPELAPPAIEPFEHAGGLDIPGQHAFERSAGGGQIAVGGEHVGAQDQSIEARRLIEQGDRALQLAALQVEARGLDPQLLVHRAPAGGAQDDFEGRALVGASDEAAQGRERGLGDHLVARAQRAQRLQRKRLVGRRARRRGRRREHQLFFGRLVNAEDLA